jgi:uncharacterized membrane protein YjjP (DUF1212 family)
MGAQSEGGKPGTYPPPDPRIGFVLALGRALHRAGEPANRLEDLMEHVARKVGIQTQFFFTPTSIFAAFGSEERQRTHLIRTEPSSPDLGRLARLDIVVVRVLKGQLAPDAGLGAIAALDQEERPQAGVTRVLGFALASAGTARVLGGGLREVAVSAMVGTGIGSLSLL